MPSCVEIKNKHKSSGKKRKRSSSESSIDDYTEIDIQEQNVSDEQGSNSDEKYKINRQTNGIASRSSSAKGSRKNYMKKQCKENIRSSANDTGRKIDNDINDDSSWRPSSSSSSSSDEENLLKQGFREYSYYTVSLNNVLSTINTLHKALEDKKPAKGSNYNCNIEDRCKSSEILWTESTYIIRYIKSCILQHNWKALSHLLYFFLNHHKHYSFFIKEISFLLSLVCSHEKPSIMETLKNCFVSMKEEQKHRFSIWHIDDEDKYRK